MQQRRWKRRWTNGKSSELKEHRRAWKTSQNSKRIKRQGFSSLRPSRRRIRSKRRRQTISIRASWSKQPAIKFINAHLKWRNRTITTSKTRTRSHQFRRIYKKSPKKIWWHNRHGLGIKQKESASFIRIHRQEVISMIQIPFRYCRLLGINKCIIIS